MLKTFTRVMLSAIPTLAIVAFVVSGCDEENPNAIKVKDEGVHIFKVEDEGYRYILMQRNAGTNSSPILLRTEKIEEAK